MDIVYTRYADDLSFYPNNRTKLNSIEKFVQYVVHQEFEINDKKICYFSNDVKKTIIGITINDEENGGGNKIIHGDNLEALNPYCSNLRGKLNVSILIRLIIWETKDGYITTMSMIQK